MTRKGGNSGVFGKTHAARKANHDTVILWKARVTDAQTQIEPDRRAWWEGCDIESSFAQEKPWSVPAAEYRTEISYFWTKKLEFSSERFWQKYKTFQPPLALQTGFLIFRPKFVATWLSVYSQLWCFEDPRAQIQELVDWAWPSLPVGWESRAVWLTL